MNKHLFKLVYLGSFMTSFSYGVMLTLPLFLSTTLNLSLIKSGQIISMGIIGVIVSITSIPYFLKYISTSVMASMGSFIYTIAIVLILYTNSIFLYLAELLLGAGWGIIYTLGPIIVSSISLEKELSKNFMFLSAFNMLGAGLSPVIVKIVIDQDSAIENIFIFAALLSFLASIIFLSVNIQKNKNNKSLPILPIIKIIFTSRSIIPLFMVFLGACIYISMMNFQFVFATNNNLNFSVFYISYTIALLFGRFFLSEFILKISPPTAILSLLLLMLVSLCLFLITTNNIFYALPSSLLGISYGLVYPLIQTQMVNNISSEKRSTYLTIFSLSYFLGVFGYPYIYTLSVDTGGILVSFSVLIFLCILDIVFGLFLFKK
ncbi:MFS transporter [Bartonella tamiae]|uniref:Major facilitator superfamily (MFS) profile domain-containing protein n=1 Tax=Bartonella tamiae Th239 TaxID=1094558 RepID=J0QTC6_9HYPH|nr:MFS transporter [Bartonella tamiae]EJF89141.1 hypothetical protein ME5_01692 [Bartonella tamiae Th239]EJF95456.1 hypothetical protein MEG_00189 [Bartonella tamiae Th307]